MLCWSRPAFESTSLFRNTRNSPSARCAPWFASRDCRSKNSWNYCDILRGRNSTVLLCRLKFPFELALADERPPDRPFAQHLLPTLRRHVKHQEAPADRLQHRLAAHRCSNSRRRAMVDVDRCPDTDLVAFAKRQQRLEARSLHPSDHVRRREHGRQLRPPCRQGVTKFHASLNRSARADRNRFGHSSRVKRVRCACHVPGADRWSRPSGLRQRTPPKNYGAEEGFLSPATPY